MTADGGGWEDREEKVRMRSSHTPHTQNRWQGGFIQENKNAKTLVLSLQTPSAQADASRTNEFGAKSESPLKWTERFFCSCMKSPCTLKIGGGSTKRSGLRSRSHPWTQKPNELLSSRLNVFRAIAFEQSIGFSSFS
jgi:hypothetical protein